jgi:hypothetical protein
MMNRRNTASSKKSQGRSISATSGGCESQFPGKLHDLIAYAEGEGLESIISWDSNGRAFRVNDPNMLVDILPLCFYQTKYRSFQRQLNMWAFERILEGPGKGAFWHPYFIRGQKYLCREMNRQTFQALSPVRYRDFQVQENVREACPSVSSDVGSVIGAISQDPNPIIAFNLSQHKCSSTNIEIPWVHHPSFGSQDRKTTCTSQNNVEKNGFRDGDRLDFEGRHFYYLDLGLTPMHDKLDSD